MRESVFVKGRRYLGEGRLIVEHVAGDEIRARCRGGGAVYELGCDERGWWCGCPARGRCAHLVALELVVAPGVEPDREPEPPVSRAGFE